MTDDSAISARAAFVVSDRSLNGHTWRLTTPEWNKVKMTGTGFVLTAPNDATMHVTVWRSGRPLQVRTSSVRYNGTTTDNASGIPYKGKRYGNITAVDVAIDKSGKHVPKHGKQLSVYSLILSPALPALPPGLASIKDRKS